MFWGTNRHNNHKKVSLHHLISHGKGLLVIPENKVPEFKKLLVWDYTEYANYRIVIVQMYE